MNSTINYTQLNKFFGKFVLAILLVFGFSSEAICSVSGQGQEQASDYQYNRPTNKSFNFWVQSNNLKFARQKKSVAIILCFLLGNFGVHRFYVNKFGTGFLQLITLGGFEIWKWIDLIRILCDDFTNSEGELLCPWGI